MEIDPAPFWANLYLHDFDADFISSLIETDEPRAIKLKNSSHFVND